MIKAIPTSVDGIEFRSKLEAHWYLCFKKFGYLPIYEPDSFSIQSCTDEESRGYIPDFYLQQQGIYVEVKPLKQSYEGHDAMSINLCCALGYQHKSILLLGSPFAYKAVSIQERCKGNPDGFHTQLDNWRDNRFRLNHYQYWRACGFYPDEEWYDKIDQSLLEIDQQMCLGIVQHIRSDTWNQLKYNK